MQHFKKRRVLHLCFVRGGLLTWGNICCVEIETDDSNYVQAEGLPAKMENVKAGRMDSPRLGITGRAIGGLESGRSTSAGASPAAAWVSYLPPVISRAAI